MPTIREMADEHARLGGTRESFHSLLGGFGLDSYSSHPDTVVGAQSEEPLVSQAPPIAPAPPMPEPLPAAPTAADAPQQRLGTRPLPYGAALRPDISGGVSAPTPSEVQARYNIGQPFSFGLPPTERALRASPGVVPQALAPEPAPTPMPYGVAGRPRPPSAQDMEPIEAALRPVGEMAALTARDYSEWDPALEAARRLESGLTTEQKASLGTVPERASARGQAAYVRLGALLGTASGRVSKFFMQQAAARDPDAWDGDEENIEIIPGVVSLNIPPSERRQFSRLWELDTKDALDRENDIAEDAIRRSGQHTVLRLAAESALDTAGAIIDFITWLYGSDIPKEFWREAPEADRRAVISKALGRGQSQRMAEHEADLSEDWRKQQILVDDAAERWVEIGDDTVGLISALAKEPEAVSKTHSMAILATAAPLVPSMMRAARFTGKPVSAAARTTAGLVGELMEAYAPKRAEIGRRIGDVVSERVAGFERTFSDPTKMADPGAQAMATEALQQASRTEAGVGTNLGEALAREHVGPEVLPSELIPERPGRVRFEERAPTSAEILAQVQEQSARLAAETGAQVPQGFVLRGTSSAPEVLPEVQAVRDAMAARRAPPEGVLEGDVVPAGIDTGPAIAGAPLGEPLALPAPRGPDVAVPYGASREAAALGRRLRLEDPSAPALRSAAEEAFSGRSNLPLEQAAMADALASLFEVARNAPDPKAVVEALIRDAGGDVLAAADAVARSRQPQQAVLRGEPELGARLEPPEVLPEVVETRAAMEAARAEPQIQVPPDPMHRVRALREQRAAADVERKPRLFGGERDLAGRHEVVLEGATPTLKQVGEGARGPIPNSRALVRIESQPSPPLEPIRIDVSPPPDAPLLLEHNPRVAAETAVDPSKFGYKFKRVRYTLEPDGRLKVKQRAKDAPEEVVELAPERRMSEAAERIIDEAVEVFGQEGVLTPGAVSKPQLAAAYEAAIDPRLPNNLQIATLRETLVPRAAEALVEKTGKPQMRNKYAEEIARVVDDAIEGSIDSPVIEYVDAAGRTRSFYVVREAMTPLLEEAPGFGRVVGGEMIKANMRREGTRARQKAVQDTYGDALMEWHPETLTAAEAARKPPSLQAELDYFIGRYLETGELPPIARNPHLDLVAEGKARIPEGANYATREGIFPSRLRRRLEKMEDASPGTLDSSRLADVAQPGVRDVRLPALDMRTIAPDGTPGAPRLSVYGPLHRTQRWIAHDRGWINELPLDIGSDSLYTFGARAANWIKAAKVPLNTSSWVGAVVGNSLSAATKLADPFASLKAVHAIMDFYRFKAGLPTHYPKEWYDGILRSQALDTSFSKDMRHQRMAPKSETLGKKLMPREGEGMFEWFDRVRRERPPADEALRAGLGVDAAFRIFDHFDNGPKLYEGMLNTGRHLEEWGMLRNGEFKEFHLSKKKRVRAIKRDDLIPGMSNMEVNGKRLTPAQMQAIVSRAAMEPTLGTYVDFSELPLIQLYKRNIPLFDVTGSPFSGWLSGSTTLPFMRRGIVGEILSGPTPRGNTNSSRVLASRAAGQTAHGAKIGASIAGLNASLSPDSGMLRRMSAYSASDPGAQIIKPTEEPGVYNIWDVKNANSFEDLDWWLRLAETGTRYLPELFGYVDPASTIEGQEYPIAMMTDGQIAKLPRFQQEIVRDSQALARDQAEGMSGLDTARIARAFRLSGSAAADGVLDIATVTDFVEMSAPQQLAHAVRGVASLIIPGAHRRAFEGGLDHMADDDMELASIRSAELRDARAAGDSEEVSRLEGEIDDLLGAAVTKRYYGRVKRGEVKVEFGDPFPLEEQARSLVDKVISRMLKSPLYVRLYDPSNMTTTASSKFKKAWATGMDRTIKGRYDLASMQASKLRRDAKSAKNPDVAAELLARADALEELALVLEDRGEMIKEYAADSFDIMLEEMHERAEQQRRAGKFLRRPVQTPFGEDVIGVPLKEKR